MPECKACLGLGEIPELDDETCDECKGHGVVPIDHVGVPNESIDAVRFLRACDAIFAPNFDMYAGGMIDLSKLICALCRKNPCGCPEFGSAEYLALIDERHGRK